MRRPTLTKIREEHANTLTHGAGAVLSVVGLAWLLHQSLRFGDTLDLVGTTIFGGTLVLLYTASALYHGAHRRQLKRLFLRFDHAGIFLLIGGTYTAVLLLGMRDATGWRLLAVVWALCLGGVVLALKARRPRRYQYAGTIVYLGLGWLVAALLDPLSAVLPDLSLKLLVIGGLAYSAGIVFFLWHKLRYHHAIWHLFVLAGSACHWVAVLDTVTRGA